MINYVYTIKDSKNSSNNKVFYDYCEAHEYLQKLNSVLFRKYLTYTSDQHEEKFFYSNNEKSWKTVRTIEIVTTIEPA